MTKFNLSLFGNKNSFLIKLVPDWFIKDKIAAWQKFHNEAR